MGQPYVGEIRLVPFNFAPAGWLFCQGQTLPISENETLFQLIGTTYGGDGQETFNIPDLQSRVFVGAGQGPGLSNYSLAETDGQETVTLTTQQIPQHSHVLNVSGALGTTNNPVGNYLATSPLALGNVYGNDAETIMLGSDIGMAGGNQPHDNMQPYLTLNFIISLFGVFPSQS